MSEQQEAAMTAGRISIGNAESFAPSRGWFVGGFLNDSAGACQRDDIEVKWGHHPTGDQRPELAAAADTASLAVLISGLFELHFPGGSPERVVLEKRGDFVLYEPGVAHTWHAITDSVILTVRWRPAMRASQAGQMVRPA